MPNSYMQDLKRPGRPPHTIKSAIASLERKYITLYNRTYASGVRRRSVHKRALNRATLLIKRVDKISKDLVYFQKIFTIMKRRKKRVVLLNYNQYMKFHNWLAHDFRAGNRGRPRKQC